MRQNIRTIERIGQFVIDTILRIGKFFKTVFTDKRVLRFLPLLVVLLFAIVTFVTCLPSAKTDPEPSSPEISDDTPSPPPTETTPVTSPEPPVTSEEPTDEPTETAPETTEPDPPYTGPVNPLTGLPVDKDISGKRPFAFVINNHRQAQPQLGVSKADIIYEMMAEGGITRMLAIYQDITDVGVIGSIRSARLYCVDLAQSYDAIFVFAGYSDEAYEALRARKITHLNGVHGPGTEAFYRDSGRQATMSFEHTLVTSDARLTKYCKENELRQELPDNYKRALNFKEDGTPEDGAAATEFDVRFMANSKTTSFKYDAENMLYYLSQYSSPYRDGVDKTQVAVTNVLILKTNISSIPGDTAGRLKITTTGTGSGYYVNGGKYIEIEWSRADNASQYKYTKKDGTELILGQGKTYICITARNLNVDFK